jgi:hypothetical protein
MMTLHDGLRSQPHEQVRLDIDHAYRVLPRRERPSATARSCQSSRRADTLQALAKLAVKHEVLSEQREEERAEPDKKGASFVLVSDRALTESIITTLPKSTASSPLSNGK